MQALCGYSSKAGSFAPHPSAPLRVLAAVVSALSGAEDPYSIAVAILFFNFSSYVLNA